MIEESRHGEAQAESGCEFVDVNTLNKINSRMPMSRVASVESRSRGSEN
jgi:hypothetical protein